MKMELKTMYGNYYYPYFVTEGVVCVEDNEFEHWIYLTLSEQDDAVRAYAYSIFEMEDNAIFSLYDVLHYPEMEPIIKKLRSYRERTTQEKQLTDYHYFCLCSIFKEFSDNDWSDSASKGQFEINKGGYDLYYEVFLNGKRLIENVAGEVTIFYDVLKETKMKEKHILSLVHELL